MCPAYSPKGTYLTGTHIVRYPHNTSLISSLNIACAHIMPPRKRGSRGKVHHTVIISSCAINVSSLPKPSKSSMAPNECRIDSPDDREAAPAPPTGPALFDLLPDSIVDSSQPSPMHIGPSLQVCGHITQIRLELTIYSSTLECWQLPRRPSSFRPTP